MKKALAFLLLAISISLLSSTSAYAANPIETIFNFVKSRVETMYKTKSEKVDSWYGADKQEGFFSWIASLFGATSEDSLPATREEIVQEYIKIIDEAVESGIEYARQSARQQAEASGGDVERTMNAFEVQGNTMSNIDYSWILAVYTIKYHYEATTLEKFKEDMDTLAKNMFTVTLTEANTTNVVRVPVYKYREVPVSICEDEWIEEYDDEGNSIGGYWEHNTHTEYYYAIEIDPQTQEPNVDHYITNELGQLEYNYQYVSLNVGNGSSCHEVSDVYMEIVNDDTCEEEGKVRVFPTFEEVEYDNVTVTQFDNYDLWEIWGLDAEADAYKYLAQLVGEERDWGDAKGGITCNELALFRQAWFDENYSQALSIASVNYATGLTRDEIQAYLDALPSDLSGNRKQVIKTALTLVDKVPYCNAGEDSKPKQTGYDASWWDYTKTDSSGRPSGLDSAGFVMWAFWTAGFSEAEVANLKTTSLISNNLSEVVKEEDIKAGDIGLFKTGITDENNALYNTVGIYMGNGKWIVNSATKGTVAIVENLSFSSIKVFSARMEDSDLWTDDIAIYSSAAAPLGESSIYVIAQVIMQECSTNLEGTLAVAECMKNRVLDTERFGSQDTVWKVITQKGQFESYESGAYLDRKPTAPIMERIQQVLDGQYTIFNNTHVLDFTSTSWYNTHKATDPNNYRWTQFEVFAHYGGNTYYIDPKYKNATGNTGIAVAYGLNDSSTFMKNGTSKQILNSLFSGGLPKSEAEARQYMSTISVQCKDINGNTYTKKLTVHRQLASNVEAIFSELYALGFPIDNATTAAFNWRQMRSSSSMSQHSYGVAIDINWNANIYYTKNGVGAGSFYRPVGGYPSSANSTWTAKLDAKGLGLSGNSASPLSVTSQVVQIFNKYGFVWGGSWQNSADYMHFSVTGQ